MSRLVPKRVINNNNNNNGHGGWQCTWAILRYERRNDGKNWIWAGISCQSNVHVIRAAQSDAVDVLVFLGISWYLGVDMSISSYSAKNLVVVLMALPPESNESYQKRL